MMMALHFLKAASVLASSRDSQDTSTLTLFPSMPVSALLCDFCSTRFDTGSVERQSHGLSEARRLHNLIIGQIFRSLYKLRSRFEFDKFATLIAQARCPLKASMPPTLTAGAKEF